MAVRSDSQVGNFTQFYDEDVDDDSDDNNFIISLEDNGDEDESYYNSGGRSSDFPIEQVPVETGQKSTYSSLYQPDLGLSHDKSSSPQNKLHGARNGCSEQEILTFPTSCISKPISHVSSSKKQTFHDSISFLSSSHQENFHNPLTREPSDPIPKAGGSAINHHSFYNPNEPCDYSKSKTAHSNPGSGDRRSEAVFPSRRDNTFVNTSIAVTTTTNTVIGNSIEQKQSLSGSFLTTSAAPVTSVLITPVASPVSHNLSGCLNSSSTKASPLMTSRHSILKANVPRLSGPFSKSPTIASVAPVTDTTHLNGCSCIMCFKSVLSNTVSKEMQPTPTLTQEEVLIIENGSLKGRQRPRNHPKKQVCSKSLENDFVNSEEPVSSVLPKLTPSRELSAAVSFSPGESYSKPPDTHQVYGSVKNVLSLVPPLLLHKSSVKRDAPPSNATSAPSLTVSQVITATPSQNLPLQTLSQTVPVPGVVIVSSATSNTTSNSSTISFAQSSGFSASSSSVPLLLQGSTNGEKIGCLVLQAPVTSFVPSQGVVTSSLQSSQTNKVFLKPNDLNNSKLPVSKLQTALVTSFNTTNVTSIPIKPIYAVSTEKNSNNTEIHSKQQVPAGVSVSLLNTPLLRQELSKKTTLTPSTGLAKTFQHDPASQQLLPPSGSYKIVYLNSGEVVLCRTPIIDKKKMDINFETSKAATHPKQSQSQTIAGPLTVNGNAHALNSVLNKAEQIDFTTPGKVRIKLVNKRDSGKSPTKITNLNSLLMTSKESNVTSQNQESVPVSKSHPSQASVVPNRNPTQKSPLQSPQTPNVTGSTLLKLIDTHIENQQLTSNEAALLQLIKGACKDPKLLAATCKIAQQVEAASRSRSSNAPKGTVASSPSVQAAKPPATSFDFSIATKVSQSIVASTSISKDIQSGNTGTFVSISAQHFLQPNESSQPSLLSKSSIDATKLKSVTTGNQPIPSVAFEPRPASHSGSPHLPQEGLPASYVEDWVNQSKTFMSNNKLEDLFCQEIREIDRCITNEVLPRYKPAGTNFKSPQKKSKMKPKSSQSLNSRENNGSISVLNKNSDSLSNADKMNCGENHSRAELAASKGSEKPTKFPTVSSKLKQHSLLVHPSKGIKLKIRLDEELKQHIAAKKAALGKKISESPTITCKSDTSISLAKSSSTIDKTNESLSSESGNKLVLDDGDQKESKNETAEEMFQRFQEQAQEEVYKAQLGVGCLSRSLRPARGTVAFLDKLPYRDMGSGERKKKKLEADQIGEKLNSFENDALQASTAGTALDPENRAANQENKDKKASLSLIKKKSLSTFDSANITEGLSVRDAANFYPNLKEDTSFPFTKNVYCSNILAGHKVFVKFNTYENTSSGRCFLVPFFNIGGRRKQFDVEDVRYFNKAIIDYEKEERSCARHLLYFCREGNKASFLRKEGSFGSSQLHEKNYCKKSFTLEGFKVAAVKSKSSTAQEAWQVDNEVDIEIDTAEVDNDVEIDFGENYIINSEKRFDEAKAVSSKETELRLSSDVSPFPSVLSDNISIANAGHGKGVPNIRPSADYVGMPSPSGAKDANKNEQLVAKIGNSSSEKHQNTFVSQAVSREEPTVSNAHAQEHCLLEIKKERPDYIEYGNGFADSRDTLPPGPANFFQPVFPLMEIKKEPVDNDFNENAYLNSNACNEYMPEYANIQHLQNESLSENSKNLCNLAGQSEKEGAHVAPSTMSEFKHLKSAASNYKDNLLSNSHDSSLCDETPSSILCTEVLSCDAEKVQVSLSDQQIDVAQIQENSFSKLLDSSADKNKAEDPAKSTKNEDASEPAEIAADESEETVTVSEVMPSSPESPAPSSTLTESSEVLSSSDMDDTDLDGKLSSSEAHLSYTGTPSVDLPAEPETKTGAGQHKITSLVESLRQRLTQQTSTLPSWLANTAPPVVHSKLKIRKKKREKITSKTGSGKDGNTIVSQSQSSAAQNGPQVSSNNSTSVSITQALVSGSSHQSEEVEATSNIDISLSHISANQAEKEKSKSPVLPKVTSAEITSNTQPKLPGSKEVLMSNGFSKDKGNSLIDTTFASSTAVKNVFTEALPIDIPPEYTNSATASLSLSMSKDFKTSKNEVAGSSFHKLSSNSTGFIPDLQSKVKQEIIDEEIDPLLISFRGHGLSTAEQQKVSTDGQEVENSCLTLPTLGQEIQTTSEMQLSCRSTPSDVDIEVGCEDLPEAALGFQPIVPDVYIDVDKPDSSSESSCMSPVATVVDFLHKRTQALSKTDPESNAKFFTTYFPASSPKALNAPAEGKGSVASYLAQKYAADMSAPGSGVWHTIKGPRLRRAAFKRPAASASKQEISVARASDRLAVVEPISTQELSKKPSLSEIFGIPVEANSKPESEQHKIKTEPLVENGSKITIKVRGSKKQVARKKTSTRIGRKDVTIRENRDLLSPKSEPIEIEPSNTDLPQQQTDSVTSLADDTFSPVQSQAQQEEPPKSSQASDTSSVKSKKLTRNSSDLIPKVRLTWRQLSKLSEKQQKESDSEKPDKDSEQNNLIPCKVLLSRLEYTDLSSTVYQVSPFTFRVIRKPITVSQESASVKVEADDCQGKEIPNSDQANKSKIGKRKKKRAGTGKTRKGSTRPKKDIIDHFACMLESLRKKALQLEEEAMKKQQEEEAKGNDHNLGNLTANETKDQLVVKKEPPAEKSLKLKEDSINLVDAHDIDKGTDFHEFANSNNNSSQQSSLSIDHAAKQENAGEVNNISLTIKSDKNVPQSEEMPLQDENQCAIKVAVTGTCEITAESNQNQDTAAHEENIAVSSTLSSNTKSDNTSLENNLDTNSTRSEDNMKEQSASNMKRDNKTMENNLMVYEAGPEEDIIKQTESDRPAENLKESNLVEDETVGEENLVAQPVLTERLTMESNPSNSIYLNESLGSENSDCKVSETILIENKLNCSQTDIPLNEKHSAEVTAKNLVDVSEKTMGELPEIEASPVIQPMLVETNTSLKALKPVEINKEALEKTEQTDYHITEREDGLKKVDHDFGEDAVSDFEQDASMDWEEPRALIIHLPEDEIGVEKGAEVEDTLSILEQTIEQNEDHASKKTTVIEAINPMSAKEVGGQEERLDPHHNQDLSNNERFPGLKCNDHLGNNHISDPKADREHTGLNVSPTQDYENRNAKKDHLACSERSSLSFPKTDVVLSSVVDEDLAACLVEKSSKKEELVMFEHPDDLDGDDMGIIPQDEVERLLGLCDEDSGPVVLPGLGPVPSFDTAANGATEGQFLNVQIEGGSSNKGVFVSSSSKLTTVAENAMKPKSCDNVQKEEAQSGQKPASPMQGSSSHAYRLPSQTTVLSESNTSGQHISSKPKDDCIDKASESQGTSGSLRHTENDKPKPTLPLQLPKLNLKLDTKALAAFHKAKSAFLKKKNPIQSRNLRSTANSEPSVNTASSKDSQFQQDMAFYMRSTRMKMTSEARSGNLNSSCVATEQEHQKTRLYPGPSKTSLNTTATVIQNFGKPLDSIVERTVPGHKSNLTSPIPQSNSIIKPTPEDGLVAINSDESTRKRRVEDHSDLDSSGPSKVKKIESIFDDIDIFKEPLSKKPSQPILAKSNKPNTHVSEILKKTKGIDISKLKMKLNPVLSKSGSVPASQNSVDLKPNEDQRNISARGDQAPSKKSKIVLSNTCPLTSSSNPPKVEESSSSNGKSKPISTSAEDRPQTTSDTSDKNSNLKPLPNLNTAKLCNLLKNIQKRPVDVKSSSETEKETESQSTSTADNFPAEKLQKGSKRNSKLGPKESQPSPKGIDLRNPTSASEKRLARGPTGKRLIMKRTAEEAEEKSERSFFDCLSTDQTEIWEESKHG
ncbi:hypothetical protein ElyMa_004881100 [Elysia marginata]|uniref:Uncharacterized protein n=1 Tax=Elysia marginata TaxID=1093978 RepID=A0AAV4IU38_9GAST|nr:hypothetical protein ElyMa_004881100 [Elysia marginata]